MSAKERLSKQEIKDKFDSFSKWYYIFEIFNSILIGRLRRGLLKQAKGKVLEIGIGTGANLKYYPTDCEITGIDLSKGMLTKAENKAAKLGIKINLREGDAENLPFKKEEFDSVVDTLGLCIYPNPIRALKEMKKVCKKKGRILLLEHGISNRQFIVNLQKKREHNHYQRIGCSLLRNPEELARKAGLKIDKIEKKLFGIFYSI